MYKKFIERGIPHTNVQKYWEKMTQRFEKAYKDHYEYCIKKILKKEEEKAERMNSEREEMRMNSEYTKES